MARYLALTDFKRFGVEHRQGEVLPLRTGRWFDLRTFQRKGKVSRVPISDEEAEAIIAGKAKDVGAGAKAQAVAPIEAAPVEKVDVKKRGKAKDVGAL